MFLETGSVLRKKAEKETNLSFGTVQLILKKDLHFFHCRVSVVDEIKPLDNKSPTTQPL
jgi:hypothetical protein